MWLRIDAFDVARHPDLGLLLVLVVDRVFHPDVFGLCFKKIGILLTHNIPLDSNEDGTRLRKVDINFDS